MTINDGLLWRNAVPMDDAQCEFPFFSAVAYNVAPEFDKCVSVPLQPQLETETPLAPTLAPALEPEPEPEPRSEPEPEPETYDKYGLSQQEDQEVKDSWEDASPTA